MLPFGLSGVVFSIGPDGVVGGGLLPVQGLDVGLGLRDMLALAVKLKIPLESLNRPGGLRVSPAVFILSNLRIGRVATGRPCL